MRIGKWAASQPARHIAFITLAIALAAALIALFVTLHRLSAVEAQRVELEQWQSELLAELGRALPGSSGRIAPADASEALAQIIASRDGALFAVAPPQSAAPGPDALPVQSQGAEHGDALPARGISKLLGRESTGAAAEDANAIDHDSRTPWKGWE